MPWRHYRREVTHREPFGSVGALLEATEDFFDRLNQTPERALSVTGAHPTMTSAGVLSGLSWKLACGFLEPGVGCRAWI